MSRVPVHTIETPDASRPMLEAMPAGPGGVGRYARTELDVPTQPIPTGA